MDSSERVELNRASVAEDGPEISEKTKVLIGSIVLGVLAVLIIGILGIYGSLLDWPADRVTNGLYSTSGLDYKNIVDGDGLISLVFVGAILLSVLLAIIFQEKRWFLVMMPLSVLYFALAIFEMVYISTRDGLIGNGLGIEMVLISGLASVLCSLTGYFMLRSLDHIEG